MLYSILITCILNRFDRQTIFNHVRNCRRCPIETRESLELMKRAKIGRDGKKTNKPKHSGRKVFFCKLWCRIQRIKIEEEQEVTDDGETTKKRGKLKPGKTMPLKREMPAPAA